MRIYLFYQGYKIQTLNYPIEKTEPSKSTKKFILFLYKEVYIPIDKNRNFPKGIKNKQKKYQIFFVSI